MALDGSRAYKQTRVKPERARQQNTDKKQMSEEAKEKKSKVLIY